MYRTTPFESSLIVVELLSSISNQYPHQNSPSFQRHQRHVNYQLQQLQGGGIWQQKQNRENSISLMHKNVMEKMKERRESIIFLCKNIIIVAASRRPRLAFNANPLLSSLTSFSFFLVIVVVVPLNTLTVDIVFLLY